MICPKPATPLQGVDATTLANWHKCRRYAYLVNVEGWQSGEPAGPLVHGQALHAGLARWYESGRLDEALLDLSKAWADGAKGLAELPPMYSLGRAEALLKAYTLHWNGGPGAAQDPLAPYIPPGGAPILEHLLEVPIRTICAWFGVDPAEAGIQPDAQPALLDWSYFGIVDMVSLWDDGLFVVDHKTTGEMGDRFGYEWHPDVQMLGYCILAEAGLNPGRPILGALINGLKMSKGVAGGRGMVFPPADKANCEFRRVPIIYTREQKRQWVLDRLIERRELIWHFEQGVFPPASRRSCSGLGKCQFHAACGGDPADFERRLSLDFVKGTPWDPRKTERL